MSGVRIDRWLWAARFFKTRSLAKAAVEGGKVHLESSRVKPSKEVQVGQQLEIRRGDTFSSCYHRNPFRAARICNSCANPLHRDT
jgi:ribosomal 50S subunit-recycling heat shock protein